MQTAERIGKSEYSTIDTSICMNGVITVDQYFQDKEIHDYAEKLLKRIDWAHISFTEGDKTMFYMSYNPDRDGDYVTENPGFISKWDMAAEQRMMYLQATITVDAELANRLYDGFRRDRKSYNGKEMIVSPGGPLFISHFTEAWLDLRSLVDKDGIDWFQNGRDVALANRQFCLDNADRYRGYEHFWGLSASEGPKGYSVCGSQPCLEEPFHDGTISIYSALSCLPFIPKETTTFATDLYVLHPQTWGKYGFYDAFNVDVPTPWYSQNLLGIDKGCSMLLIENYYTGLIWKTYNASPYIQNALKVLQFKEKTAHESVII
jgi:hypothetical protein